MTKAPHGYAVVDTETTGLLPGFQHRIAEIAVIHLAPDGTVTDEWSTLINPQRDLGPQHIHGIRAAEILHAPRFSDIAADIVERLRGRLLVAHNWRFDAMHLQAEFARYGLTVPLHANAGLCTMQLSGTAMPWTHRSLIECCAAAGLPERTWHTAHDDALGTASLLAHLLDRFPQLVTVTEAHLALAGWPWPMLAPSAAVPVHRRAVGHVEPHFLARLVDRLPRADNPDVDAYYLMLDRALLDRQISATEADMLLALAYQLGLHRSDVTTLHLRYLRELACAAWEDGVITDNERRDLATVATALGLHPDTVTEVLADTENTMPHTSQLPTAVTPKGLRLEPGDTVVLTGDMTRPRTEIAEQATSLGLRVTSAVSRKTRVVAAADPDSLSAKARRARDLGIPVVHGVVFLQMLDTLAAAIAG